MPRSLVVAIGLLLGNATFADTPKSVAQIPAVERPRDHFYGAIGGGRRLVVRWEVEPAAVPLGENFNLSLIVTHAVNPHELSHPRLLELTEFQTLFSAVQELPAMLNPEGEVVLRYQVTPRNEGNYRVPELKFNYYRPSIGTGSRTQTVRALAVPYIVTKPVVSAAKAGPLDAPPEFFAVREDKPLTRSGGPSGWLWASLFATGATVGAGWVLVWRWKFPDVARLTMIRRNRAVRIALDRLRRPNVTPAEVAVTVRNYLIARWGLAFTAQTPTEVTEGLTEIGIPPEIANEAGELLQACDAARFAGSEMSVPTNRATALIELWEGAMVGSTQT